MPLPNRILTALAADPGMRGVLEAPPGPGERLQLGGVHGSAGTAALAVLHDALPSAVLVAVCPGPAEAAAVETDLEVLLGEGKAFLFPQREALPFEAEESHLEISALQVEALEAFTSGRSRLLVTTRRALQERNPVPRRLTDLRLTLGVGESFGFSRLLRELDRRGFERVSLVEEVGQYAVRGGIVDLFSLGSLEPARIEFWGDEVASIRLFDILDQRSTREVERVHVLPVALRRNGEGEGEEENRSLLELLPRQALLVEVGAPRRTWAEELRRTWSHVLEIHEDLVRIGHRPPPPESLFLTPGETEARLGTFPRILTGEGEGDHTLRTGPPPAIERKMDRLRAFLVEGAARGEETLLLCDNEGQVERLEEILGGADRLPPGTHLVVGSLAGGFLLHSSSPPLRVLTDHEIFRRSRRLRRRRRFRGAVALESLAQLTPGDHVVHLDHGIGVFRGLERIRAGGQEMEALAIEYAGGEILRVPVYRVDLVERWVGETDDAPPPKIDRLGGRRWKSLRRRTEAAVEATAAELLELYARRASTTGFAFSPDTRWQKEMESAFLYEDTPDQRKAAEDVKRDMERPRPMDRLVCGDVGYGKTEVAVRAAFKAVQDGKQVAVLAPTTILVEQHRRTFEERLADYPVRIGALSRFRTPREQRELLLGLAQGEVDIVVGTHRLLSPDVVFKDLGLLVVDEEQRFGVRHKERLKQLRTSVDVLTLTATPIPRTLYLSLAGIRDLSLIRTPPRDRMPIITHVLPWSDQIVAEALQRELDRGGQVFFVHNRVETIHTAAERIRRLAPEARVAVAHGQMPGGKLDRTVRAFVEGELDVLVCTSIIENGMDVPNANTLLVDRADRFGLAQLYQIRGRVGRSDRRAYCYLIVPDDLPEEADRRLRVLEHYTELGSGYSVALRDLELRGAGNLLGADQSGFAHAVGLDTYLRLLEDAVRRLKGRGERRDFPEPEISLGAAALLPDSYVSDAGQKLHLYRRISRLREVGEIRSLRRELEDRFGALPPEAEALLEGAALRILGQRLGVQRILLRDREARVSFQRGVAPRLTVLQGPLEDRNVEVEVRRLDPLSFVLRQSGPGPLLDTLREALALLSERQAAAD